MHISPNILPFKNFFKYSDVTSFDEELFTMKIEYPLNAKVFRLLLFALFAPKRIDLLGSKHREDH